MEYVSSRVAYYHGLKQSAVHTYMLNIFSWDSSSLYYSSPLGTLHDHIGAAKRLLCCGNWRIRLRCWKTFKEHHVQRSSRPGIRTLHTRPIIVNPIAAQGQFTTLNCQAAHCQAGQGAEAGRRFQQCIMEMQGLQTATALTLSTQSPWTASTVQDSVACVYGSRIKLQSVQSPS